MTSGQTRGGGDVAAEALLQEGTGVAAAVRGALRQSWLVLGVDPGEQGAVALIRCRLGTSERPRLEELEDVSDRLAVRQLASLARLIVVEGQQASPQMGVTGAFRLGMAYGGVLEAVHGVQAATGAEVAVVFPTAWRGSYGLGGGKWGKVDGLELARRLLREQGEGLARHDQADAVLLGWWGWRHRLLARVMQELQAG